MKSDRVSLRGVVPSPFAPATSLVAGQASEPIRVVPGRTYQLRTDAEDVDAGAVTYPLVWVAEAQSQKPLARASGAPFHKLSPLTVTPQKAFLVFGCEADCNVWVLQQAEASDEKDCGCAACSGEPMGPLSDKQASACGCKKTRA